MEDGWWLFWGHPACTAMDHNTFRGEKEEMEVRKVFIKEVEENFRLFPTHGWLHIWTIKMEFNLLTFKSPFNSIRQRSTCLFFFWWGGGQGVDSKNSLYFQLRRILTVLLGDEMVSLLSLPCKTWLDHKSQMDQIVWKLEDKFDVCVCVCVLS